MSTPDNPKPALSKVLPGPAHLRQYPAYNLVAWQPQGIFDDSLLDDIGEWLVAFERASKPFNRFVDFSRLTAVSIRTSHVFKFAQKRLEKFTGPAPVRSALFSEDWVGFGVARLYEGLMQESPIQVRAFRRRTEAAIWLDVPVEILNLDDQPACP